MINFGFPTIFTGVHLTIEIRVCYKLGFLQDLAHWLFFIVCEGWFCYEMFHVELFHIIAWVGNLVMAVWAAKKSRRKNSKLSLLIKITYWFCFHQFANWVICSWVNTCIYFGMKLAYTCNKTKCDYLPY